MLLAQTGTPSGAPILAFNSAVLTGNGTTTSASFVALTTNSLVMPTLPPNTTRIGRCVLVWETSATADNPTFALNTNNALTGLWILGGHYYQSTTAITNFLPVAVTTTAKSTAVSAALTAAASSTFYTYIVDFSVQTGATTETITLFAEISGGTLTVQAGSACGWYP